jgi:nitrate reductase cytochrome c-type subunit
MLGSVSAILLGLVVLAVVGVLGIAGWEYTNSDRFCATMCHSVHPEESVNHANASHARVNCVECHMGRTSTLHLMTLKPTHLKELWGMVAGYERPTYGSTLRPAREACEACHWPQNEHHDKIVVKKRFATDPASSEIDYRITLHTSAGIEREQDWKATGIHWHITNDVEFIATDPQRRSIPWVQVKKPDGSKVTYFDAESKLSKAELDKLEPRRMECFDCHNATGHPFRNPVDVVDEAIASGRIDRSLPSAKARAVGLIDAVGEMHGTMDARAKQVDAAIVAMRAKFQTSPRTRRRKRSSRR